MDVKLIDAELPKEMDFTVPSRFLETKFPQRTLFQPGANTFITECRPYGLNWVAVWCMSYVCTNGYVYGPAISKKNYFSLLLDDGKPQMFRTWSEGVQAGVQTIVALMKLPADEKPIVWPKTVDIAKDGKPGYKLLKDFESYYGEGFAEKVVEVYDELLKFAKGEAEEIKLPNPVVVGPSIPLPPVKPLPPLPEPSPVPSRPIPDTGAKPAWKLKLAGFLGVIGSVWWLARMFVPGGVGQVVDAIIAILKQLIN
jgi:hypothetical protein